MHVRFETPMNLHSSQTDGFGISPMERFETPMNLHSSQTSNQRFRAGQLPQAALRAAGYAAEEGRRVSNSA